MLAPQARLEPGDGADDKDRGNHPNADILEEVERAGGGERIKISHSLAYESGGGGNRNFDNDDFDF